MTSDIGAIQPYCFETDDTSDEENQSVNGSMHQYEAKQGVCDQPTVALASPLQAFPNQFFSDDFN